MMDTTREHHELLTAIAIDYYQKGVTQEEISKKFNISRVRVGRLLKVARDEGIVNITVNYHPVYSSDIEKRLKERFKITRALIAIDQKDEELQRLEVANLVSTYLSRRIEDDMTIAVGQGRNVASIAHGVGGSKKSCKFISSIGGVHPRGNLFNADHICRQLSKKFGGNSESMYAPAYVKDKELRKSLMEVDTVKQTLLRARKADIALVGVGDMRDNSFMVELGWFSSQEIIDARINLGVVGDLAGYDFFDSYGNPVQTNMDDRIIGLSINDYLNIQEVIAIASENTKSYALLGALRSGVVDVLATSMSNALAILSLDNDMK